ncbi:uncharacterized protein LOC135692626 isoform X1 [Rhopilema esculentum]|uniref:uncharacterized protein LOC135692626 isoform X1 n=1 Tax=Rhopilema esculentum TaxID=499914 RepID=UPI0031DD6980
MDVKAIIGMKALIIAAMSSICLEFTNASVTVRIELMKFDNHGSKAYDKGRSCFIFGFGTCNTFFKICIKPSKDMPSSLSDCWFSNQTTDRNTNTIDFASVKVGLPKVIEINRDSWPGNIGFYIRVYDKDFIKAPDLMDIHKYRKEVTAESNGSRLVNYNETSIGERPHKPASILTFRLQVSCDLNYYGNSCQKYCKEYDDSANGHYGCDKNGDRFCQKGWYNLPNCSQHCLPQNDDFKGHYNCSKNGTRLCHYNWTGINCNINKNKAISTFALPSSQSLQSLLSQTKTVLKPRTSVILLSRSIGHISLKSSAISPTLNPSVDIRQSSTTSLLQMSKQIVFSSRSKFSEHSSIASTAMSSRSVTASLKLATTQNSKILSSSTSIRSSDYGKYPSRNTRGASNSASTPLHEVSFAKTIDIVYLTAKVSSILSTLHKPRMTSTSRKHTTAVQYTSSFKTAVNGYGTVHHKSSTLTVTKLSTKGSIDGKTIRETLSQHVTAEIKASRAPNNSSLLSAAIAGPTQVTPDNIASATDDNSNISKTLTRYLTSAIKASKAPRNSSLPSSAISAPTKVTPDNIASATDDFQWMVSTRRGILVLIGFALALVFLACLLCALVKICRMRRYALQPQRFHNDSDNTEEIHIRRQCDERKMESLQMCTGCFGGVPGQLGMQTHNYPYQKQETDM